jgi:hypothetical protein
MIRKWLGGIWICVLPAAVWLGVVLACATAWADGGAVVLAERAGDYQVTVLASPVALHVGPADLSVLVQDAATGQPVDGLLVTLSLAPEGSSPADGLVQPATRAAATNKLFYAAKFELSAAGRWTLSATVENRQRTETIQGVLEVAGPPPRWLELWPWIGWPVVVVLLFALRERLVCAHRQRRMPPRVGAAIG